MCFVQFFHFHHILLIALIHCFSNVWSHIDYIKRCYIIASLSSVLCPVHVIFTRGSYSCILINVVIGRQILFTIIVQIHRIVNSKVTADLF